MSLDQTMVVSDLTQLEPSIEAFNTDNQWPVVSILGALIQAARQAEDSGDLGNKTKLIQSVSLRSWERLKGWIQGSSHVPKPLVIGITGGSGSGKSALCSLIAAQLAPYCGVAVFSQDHYYVDFSQAYPHVTPDTFYHQVDLDDPSTIRWEAMADDLQRLKRTPVGQSVRLPKLVYGTPSQLPTLDPEGQLLSVAPIVITEGIHALHHSRVRACYDLSLFVSVDEPIRRQRWVDRNQRENRGVTDHMWQTTVQCMGRYVLPSRVHADMVFNNSNALGVFDQFLSVALQRLSQPPQRGAS